LHRCAAAAALQANFRNKSIVMGRAESPMSLGNNLDTRTSVAGHFRLCLPVSGAAGQPQ
jgi:hypothetical protein